MKHIFLRALCLLCAVMLLGAFALTGCGETTPDEDVFEAVEGHDHEKPAVFDIRYTDEEDGKMTLTVKDCQGNELFSKKGMTTRALSQELSESVFSFTWITSNNPGGYETIYFDRLTCRTSGVITGEQASDGHRIVYSEIKDGALNVIVRDLFDPNDYYKVTKLEDAYTAGEYTVLGTIKTKNHQVNVSYLTDKDGAHVIKAFNLYENDEEKPAETTKTTKGTKPTKSTKKTQTKG